MNTKLLLEVRDQILKEPRQVVMERWSTMKSVYTPKPIPNCGTAGCIALWTVATSRRARPSDVDANDRGDARALLGLSALKAYRLFYLHLWPLVWLKRYKKTSPQSLARAKVIAMRIDAFIKSEGKELAGKP